MLGFVVHKNRMAAYLFLPPAWTLVYLSIKWRKYLNELQERHVSSRIDERVLTVWSGGVVLSHGVSTAERTFRQLH